MEITEELNRLRSALETVLDWAPQPPDWMTEKEKARWEADFAAARAVLSNGKDQV